MPNAADTKINEQVAVDPARSVPSIDERAKYRLQNVERAIDLLFRFSPQTPHRSLDDLATDTGVHKTSLLRILRTLEPLGFVLREGDAYRLGPRVLELANAYLSTLSFPKVAESPMKRLARACRQTVSLGILDGTDVVYVAIEHAQNELGIQGEIGGRHPVHATALGKVLLAGLAGDELVERLAGHPFVRLTHRTLVDPDDIVRVVDDVRRDGYAVDDEERGIGIRCVAAPIRDHRGRIVAAMSVAGPIFHMTEDAIPGVRARLLEAVAEVSYELGFAGETTID